MATINAKKTHQELFDQGVEIVTSLIDDVNDYSKVVFGVARILLNKGITTNLKAQANQLASIFHDPLSMCRLENGIEGIPEDMLHSLLRHPTSYSEIYTPPIFSGRKSEGETRVMVLRNTAHDMKKELDEGSKFMESIRKAHSFAFNLNRKILIVETLLGREVEELADLKDVAATKRESSIKVEESAKEKLKETNAEYDKLPKDRSNSLESIMNIKTLVTRDWAGNMLPDDSDLLQTDSRFVDADDDLYYFNTQRLAAVLKRLNSNLDDLDFQVTTLGKTKVLLYSDKNDPLGTHLGLLMGVGNLEIGFDLSLARERAAKGWK